MRLYHGTSLDRLEPILKRGIRPRGKNVGNWPETVESNPNAVYLTNAYAIYFALMSGENATHGVVFEIESDRLNQEKLGADEDAVAQYFKRRPEHSPIKDKHLLEMTRYFRSRVLDYNWQASLKLMGNCCYVGTVPLSAITRYAVINYKKARQLSWDAGGPTISLSNYIIRGAMYRTMCRWIFNDQPLEGDEPSYFEYNETMASHMPPQAIVERDGVKKMADWWMPPDEDKEGIQIFELAGASND